LPEMLSREEAATRAGKTTKTIANWIRAGHVRATRDDAGRQVVDLASLDAYLARQGKTPAQLPDGAKGLPELVSLLERAKRFPPRRWHGGISPVGSGGRSGIIRSKE
jgi:hypothetical protein